MKFSQLIDKTVFAEGNFIVGKVKDAIIDPEEWKVTHLEVELTKETTEEIIGVKPAFMNLPRNTLAISALQKGDACCTEKGIELKVVKGQLPIYLRPI
jgi:sporulation protein YlmC with PRC-barrel domain